MENQGQANPAPMDGIHNEENKPPAAPAPPSAQQSSSEALEYESNPFLNAVRGLIQILKFNPGTALLGSVSISLAFIVLWVLCFVIPLATSSTSTGASVLRVSLIAFGLGAFILYAVGTGLYFAIAAKSINKEKLLLRNAWALAFKKFIPFVVMYIIYALMIFIGFVLLIVPGFIVIARGSLAPVLIFEENLGPIAAIKRSFSLTKGHVFEMLGALFAGWLMSSGGLLAQATVVAPIVGRYQDLKQLKESGAPKPKISKLNYLPYALLVTYIALVLIFIFAVIRPLVNRINNDTTKTNTNLVFTSTDNNSLFDNNSQDFQSQ